MAPHGAPQVFTAASLAELGAVRALIEDVLVHQRDADPVVLIVDGGAEIAGATVLGLSDLDLDERTRHELECCAGGPDLAAALAPALGSTLLARPRSPGAPRPLVYLSPEVEVLGPLDDLAELARGSTAVLIARRATPVPSDQREPSASELVALGAFDPGIVALGPEALEFARSWHDALRSLAAEEGAQPARAVRALDAAATRPTVVVYRGARHGLAYWNLDEWSARELFEGESGGLCTINHAGFDPGRASLWTAELDMPRVLAGDLPELAARLSHRAKRLGPPSPVRSAVRTLSDGAALDERLRRLFRKAMHAHLERGSARPPDPLDSAGPEPFYRFLTTPDPDDPAYASVPRVLADVHRVRDDLRWHFPRVTTVDAARFRTWVEQHGLSEEKIAPGLTAALAATSWWHAPSGVVCAPPEALRDGVVLSGHLGAQAGVGEAARLFLEALSTTPIAHRALGFDRADRLAGESEQTPAAASTARADLDTNLIVVNADQLLGFAAVVGPEFFDGRYNVGSWVWETEELPVPMRAASELLDEIWVPSEYVRHAVEPFADRPVHVLAYPIVAPHPGGSVDLSELGLDNDRPLILVMLDFLSCGFRKNPLGALEAFVRAIKPGEGPQLLIKTVNGAQALDELEAVRVAAQGRDDVSVVDRPLSSRARAALIARCDVLLSLHRAEGFGLVLGEAMALGRSVVATGYSGNLDFMDEDTAFLVPATRVAVGRDLGPYPAGGIWGEPDLEVAAEYLQRALFDKPDATARAARARRRVAEFGLERAATVLQERLAAIDARRRQGYCSESAAALRRAL